jgi:hypothetical protein
MLTNSQSDSRFAVVNANEALRTKMVEACIEYEGHGVTKSYNSV